MMIIILMIVGIISSIIDKDFIEKHIVMEIDPNEENF